MTSFNRVNLTYQLPNGAIIEHKHYDYLADEYEFLYQLKYIEIIEDKQFNCKVWKERSQSFKTVEQALTWYKLYCE